MIKNGPIVPTKLGIGFVFLIFLILIIGINYSNNLIFTFSFFALSVFFISIWLGFRNIAQIDIDNIRVKPAHLGQTLVFEISARERSGVSHHYLTLQNSNEYFHINAHEECHWALRVNPQERGLRAQIPLYLSSRWPLGFFSLKKCVGSLPEVLVYASASSDRPIDFCFQSANAHQRSDAQELEGLREYQAGDNIKRIDWRAMARRQQLQVKEFDGAKGDTSLWLDWAHTQNLAYEDRISCLTHWVLDCQQNSKEFGLRLPENEIAPSRDLQHVHNCLKALALLPVEQNQFKEEQSC